jgi:hypothetical protein
MEIVATIRYTSGREEKFEVELIGGEDAPARLAEFANNPSLMLRTPDELIVIPAGSIECISLEVGEYFTMPTRGLEVRNARRLS